MSTADVEDVLADATLNWFILVSLTFHTIVTVVWCEVLCSIDEHCKTLLNFLMDFL